VKQINLLLQGGVQINNRNARLGDRVKPSDTVVVDGSIMKAPKKDKLVYIALNKPVGITTTTEQHVRGNIIDFVNFPKRIFPIGRLDKDSEGLIFLTNDGDIVNKILRAGNRHEKEYIVRVNKPIDTAFIQKMSGGLTIMNERTLPCKVSATGRQTFRIILTQGLNRQIRRMCESLDYAVTSLQRVRIMNIKLDKLVSGKWRYLSEPEITTLLDSVKTSDASEQPVVKPSTSKPKQAEIPDTKKEKLTVQKKPAPKPKEPGKKPKKSSYKEYRRNKR
jgi:23S rRNA pseudouridine2604 synthase